MAHCSLKSQQCEPFAMMDLDLSDEAFGIRDPWRLHILNTGEAHAVEKSLCMATENAPRRVISKTHAFTVETEPSENFFAPQAIVTKELKITEQAEFQYGGLLDLPSLDTSDTTEDEWKTNDLAVEPAGQVADDFDELWSDIVTNSSSDSAARLLSWENFLESSRSEKSPTYLSEAGDSAFNTALQMHDKKFNDPREISVIGHDVFLRSLMELGLGRSSALFHYNQNHKVFDCLNREHNVSTFSKQSAHSIIETLRNCGRLTRLLRDFVDRTYTSGKTYPAKVALANTVTTIIDALETQLTSVSTRISSVLQLQNMFEKPHRMLAEVYELAKAVRNARTNEDLASLVYKRCQYCDHEPNWLRIMLLQILARVSQPWLDLADQWAGYKDDIGIGLETEATNFVECEMPSQNPKNGEDTPLELLYTYRSDKLPSFISVEDGRMLFNIGRDIRILRVHDPEHPITRSTTAQAQKVCLQWQKDWEQVDRVADKARAYQLALCNAIKAHRTGKVSSVNVNSAALEGHIYDTESFDPFTLGLEVPRTINTNEACSDDLFSSITALLHDSSGDAEVLADFSPPTTIMSALSFNPPLLAQQSLVNAAMLRLFFRKHDLRHHFDLQRDFHLFGNGVFVSRLGAALFDPDQASTERQRGVMRSGSAMGLRLGSRGTWPPASSELRLALMGILTDCYQSSFAGYQRAKKGQSRDHNKDLPGSLSFAIRQLSEDEAEKILDADSLHALDFLRLQYTTPSPLAAVITQASLDRYDTIFKFLLRLTRLLFVIAHIPRTFSSPRLASFRWQADAFVTTCCRYFFNNGVRDTWNVFEQYLISIERRLKEEDDAGEIDTRIHDGIEDVRKQHDACLDRISFALLLRTRQQKVMKVLEDVLTTVLQFSKMCHGTSEAEIDLDRVKELHGAFNDNVRLFIEVCRGLAGKKGYGKIGTGKDGSTFGNENTIERLVVALDFNGFYERRS